MIDKQVLQAKKMQIERERDQLLAEINLRIGALRTIDELLVLADQQPPAETEASN